MKSFSIIVHAAASIIIVASNCAAQIRSPAVAVEPPARLPSPAAGLPQAVLSGTVCPTIFGSPQSNQDESPLTLETLEKLALSNSPVVEKAQADLRALRGKWIQAGLYPNPVLGYAGDEMGDAGTAGKQGGFVHQEIVTAGKLGARKEVAARKIEQAEQRFAAQNLRVLTDVRAAYFDVLLAQERIKVTRRISGLSESASETVARLLEARQATRVDLLQAQVETET